MAIQEKHRLSGHYNTLNMLWNLGGLIFIGFVFWLASKDKFAAILLIDKIHFVMAATLAVISFFLFIAWAAATHKELALFGEFLKETDAPPLGMKPHFAIVLIAIFLAVLINYADNILIYSAIMIAFTFIDIWGERIVRQIIRKPIEVRLKNGHQSVSYDAALIMKKYYFLKPHFEKVYVLATAYWISFTIALVGYIKGDETLRNIAYVLVILTIITGEVVIWIWRISYYRQLDSKSIIRE